MLADKAIDLFVKELLPGIPTILNIGDVNVDLDSPDMSGEQTRALKIFGSPVLTVSLNGPSDLVGKYQDLIIEGTPFDAIFCSHVLEHQRNPGIFLDKIHSDLKEGGLLAITVPPARVELKGGHVTVWNRSTLLYQLILAGFDCREADVQIYKYNISVIVRKRTVRLRLRQERGDLKIIQVFLPQRASAGK